MLTQLSVKNLAIVEAARIDFAGGMNVVTGETGAGKSVIIGAISLLLGERADKGIIRSGTSEASAGACFELNDSARADAILEEAGLPRCEGGQLIIRRTLSTTGSGRCWVNDAPTTLQMLRVLGEGLVDMHGPYDHQSLLSPDFQREILDAFGNCDSRRAAFRESYDQWRVLQRERAALAGDSTNVAEEIDRLSFAVEEIAFAALTGDDEDSLVERHAEAANAEEILRLGTGINAALDEGDGSVSAALIAAQQPLAELARLMPEAAEWLAEARAATLQVQELSRTISGRLQQIEADPGLLEKLEARMGLVQRLKRKYGATVADVLRTLDEKSARLRELQNRGERLSSLDGEIAAAFGSVRQRAAALSDERRRAADKLARAITRELRDLGFAKAAFEVDLETRDPAPHGADTVSFRFAPNLGEPASALREIASSGEIARVMLAVKSVLAEHDRIPVLVFDEIDANIGGEIGRAVGRKLRILGRSRQVICITHLAQVAAYGNSHLAVSKHIHGKRTCAEIVPVGDGESRAAELARMVGGADMTPISLEHAREMLKACQQEENKQIA